MDTTEVAQHLNTSPRTLRAFLRSPMSTFVAVGSGARYDFNDRDLPTIAKRFSEWQAQGRPKPPTPARAVVIRSQPNNSEKQRRKDMEVWSEEPAPVLPDIRDPRVRRRVLAAAREAEERLMLRLMAAGLHITQLGDSA